MMEQLHDKLDKMRELCAQHLRTVAALKRALRIAELLGVSPKELTGKVTAGVCSEGSSMYPWRNAIFQVTVDEVTTDFPIFDVHQELWPPDMLDKYKRFMRKRPKSTMALICAPESDYVWRVQIYDDNRTQVRYIGFCPIDGADITTYDSFSDIPDWMQHRIAALQMMPPNPEDSTVYGVGRRIKEKVYWVVQ